MPRIIAIAEALGVTVILGSTLVLVKIVLRDLGPLTITAFRYALAFVLLVPFLLLRGGLGRYACLLWTRFILLDTSFYVVGNGAPYTGLKFIPATTGSLLLREILTQMQLAGLVVLLVGRVVFFSPGLKPGEPLGIAITSIGFIGNAAFEILGREVQRKRLTVTLTLTAIVLLVGSIMPLSVAVLIEGLTHTVSPQSRNA